MKVKTTFLSLLLAVLLALTACGQTAPPTAAETTTTAPAPTAAATTAAPSVIDMAGRKVELAAPAERVVAVMPSDVEIIYALGAGEVLVGRGEYADYPAEVSDVTAVASGGELNAEQIIALEPDLVLLTTMAQSVEQLELIEKAGIKVAVSNAQDIAGVYEAIGLIGRLLGKTEAADALTADMKARFENVRARAAARPDETTATVYFEVSPLEFGLWTAGGHTFMDEIVRLAGGENAFADVEGWAEISEEQVIERDPAAIVTVAMYFGEGPKPDEEIAARKGWADLQAVRNKRIFLADADEFSRPGPRLADGAEALFAFLYPDAP